MCLLYLTEGEGGFEEALLEAIGRDEALLDPSKLFRKSAAQGEIDSEDAAYWNVELTQPEGETLTAEYAAPFMQGELQPTLEADPLIQEAIRLGGIVSEDRHESATSSANRRAAFDPSIAAAVKDYLDSVHIITDETRLSALHTELFDLLQTSPVRLCDWLRDNHVVFPGCEEEVASHTLRLMQAAKSDLIKVIPVRSVVVNKKSRKPVASKSRKRDLLAVPEDAPQPKRQPPERLDENAPLQLALF